MIKPLLDLDLRFGLVFCLQEIEAKQVKIKQPDPNLIFQDEVEVSMPAQYSEHVFCCQVSFCVKLFRADFVEWK